MRCVALFDDYLPLTRICRSFVLWSYAFSPWHKRGKFNQS